MRATSTSGFAIALFGALTVVGAVPSMAQSGGPTTAPPSTCVGCTADEPVIDQGAPPPVIPYKVIASAEGSDGFCVDVDDECVMDEGCSYTVEVSIEGTIDEQNNNTEVRTCTSSKRYGAEDPVPWKKACTENPEPKDRTYEEVVSVACGSETLRTYSIYAVIHFPPPLGTMQTLPVVTTSVRMACRGC